MYSLADFLNHGTLPFVGREAELASIIDFWRGTFQATELRAMLLTGEAGIGKSRLLERAMARIGDAGGSVVHVKLYPESTASFISLIARALSHPNAGREILAEEPGPTLGTVGDAMRRLARLRPTLFVLEDLHLLTSEAIPELVRLLKLLADETISVLALARPVELDARGALESYLTDELVLSGLGPDECATIWEEVSGAVGNAEVSAALHDATLGNPLALRSALRGVLKSASAGGAPAVTANHAHTLARTIKRTVGLLADGMTAHLSREELKGAKAFALLGEVFAREAADLMIDDAGAVIEALLFKGIISTVVAAPDTLAGEPSARPPLGFTHTLLHRQLIDDALVEADDLVRVIADGPLYSILPFQLLAAGRWRARSLERETLVRAFDRTIRVLMGLIRGPLWRSSEHIYRTAIMLLQSRLGEWKREEWERMLVKVIYHKISLVRREPVQSQRHWLDYISVLTAGPSSDEMATGRLYALSNRMLRYGNPARELARECWEEAEALIEARPHLRLTFAYTDYVGAACITAFSNHDTAMKRRIEERATELLGSPDLPAGVRGTFVRKVRPPLLSLFESEDELRMRLEQVAEFERSVEWSDMSVWVFCIDLLSDIGAMAALDRICGKTIPAIREHEINDLVAYAVVRQLRVAAGAGMPFTAIVDAFDEALAPIAEASRSQVVSMLAPFLVGALLLRDDAESACAIVERYGLVAADLQAEQPIALALGDADPLAALKALTREGIGDNALAPLVDWVFGTGAGADLDSVATSLCSPILRLSDILRARNAAGLIRVARQRDRRIPADMTRAVADALGRALEWLAEPERGLFAYMRPILDRDAEYFRERTAAAWRKRIDEIAASQIKPPEAVPSGRMRLSMLGTIALRMPDGSHQRFQGARVRMLLAMMVINDMLRLPLSSAEFCRLAAGQDGVEIGAARDIIKTTVHRLRDTFGREAILTGGETPRLNPELVEVDIHEANGLLKRASEAMQRSSPMQAKAALMGALAITRGEVLFPSLYDDLVEAMREDFENELRTVALDLAAALRREGGVGDAADVLRATIEAIPGDEELAEVLRDTLLRAGRHADAERVRMKTEVA